MAKFNKINPNTKKVWRLQELHDAYSDQLQTIEVLENKVSKIKGIEYNWSTVTKQFRSLVQKQIAKETKTIWKDAKTIYSSLSFELINHPSK